MSFYRDFYKYSTFFRLIFTNICYNENQDHHRSITLAVNMTITVPRKGYIMTITDRFLDKYRELEVAVRYAYKLGKYESAVSFLKKQKRFSKYSADIDYLSDIRNLLSHNRKIIGEYAVQPSEQVLTFMDALINAVNGRKKCRDIAIRFADICRRTPSAKVNPTIKTMHERNYTHIPIVANHRVVGVFSRNSIFTFVAEHSACALSSKPELTFAEISDYTKLDGREKEDYIYVKSDTYVDELENILDGIAAKGRRVGLIFLTKNGTKNEPITGMLTPWDVRE